MHKKLNNSCFDNGNKQFYINQNQKDVTRFLVKCIPAVMLRSLFPI